MTSMATNISSDQATSPDHSYSIMVRNYERDDTRLVLLNDAVEDALSKILRFGFDTDRVLPMHSLREQVLAWVKPGISLEMLS